MFRIKFSTEPLQHLFVLPAITEIKRNPPLDLKEEGYLDHVFRRAVEEGIDPVKAVQMCTINPARWIKLDDLFGSISPGKVADIMLLKNLERFEVEKVIVNGK